MPKTYFLLLHGLLWLLLPALAPAAEMLVCGWDEVFVVNPEQPGTKLWSWKAAERPELPPEYRDKFRTTDECKPVSGNRVLITASSSGVALVDRATRQTTFWASCVNAHSADLLPGERIAVACSVAKEGGNRLVVFDAKVPGKELYSTELYSGHGAVWDPGRRVLWALSGRDLRAYRLENWESPSPSLRLDKSHPLPSSGGHELTPVPGSPLLIVSTGPSVYLFDRDSGAFREHPDLGQLRNVKSVTVQAESGQLAFTQGETPNWWTGKVEFLHPAGTMRLPGERIYKVRWVQ